MPKVLEDCVKKLMEKGKEEKNAYAICTAQLQKAGILKPGTRDLAEGSEGRSLVLEHDDGTVDILEAQIPEWFTEQKEPMKLQTVIISKEVAKSEGEARKMANKFADGEIKDSRETVDSYRFRVRDPGDFLDGSFRTIHPTKGVAMVLGKLKNA